MTYRILFHLFYTFCLSKAEIIALSVNSNLFFENMSHFGVRLVSLFTLICIQKISKSKSGILQKKISDCNDDQKKLFKIVDTLLGRNKQTAVPKYDSPLTMASLVVLIHFLLDY